MLPSTTCPGRAPRLLSSLPTERVRGQAGDSHGKVALPGPSALTSIRDQGSSLVPRASELLPGQRVFCGGTTGAQQAKHT